MSWKRLDSLIAEFESLMWARCAGLSLDRPDWKAIWGKAAEIQEAFRGVRYPTREQREEAWNRFNALRDQASSLAQREREERRWRSQELRGHILQQAEFARPGWLAWPDVEKMRAFGHELSRARQMLSEYKHEMLGEHKQECFNRIQEVQKEHDAWWGELRREQTRRREERQARIRANLESNYERHRRASEALERLRRHADNLRDRIASAWNRNWAAGAERRLCELEGKIADIEDSLQKIEEWIREDENRLKW